ncbi:MAG: Rpn family recombination-promoting nuclease/putative transposase, partial [Cytophagales bacterium]|nr:Rpn family recombination-promoting nuclease/putative transposase [Cytophagales bacterium]
LDRKTRENDLDKIFFTFVELPKFKKLLKEEGRSLQELTLEEKWYYFLLHASQTTEAEQGLLSRSTEIKEAYEALNYYGLTVPERRSYESSEKNRLDELAIRDKLQEEATQKGREEGREEGKKEGREEGRKEGMKIGKEKGREEGRELRNIEIAKSMLAKNLSVDTISAVTGLSLKQVKALQ